MAPRLSMNFYIDKYQSISEDLLRMCLTSTQFHDPGAIHD